MNKKRLKHPIVLGVALALLAGCAPAENDAAISAVPSRTVSGQILTSQHGPAAAINIVPSFQYAGGQRVILGEDTDVEQHFFVTANDSDVIERMYWIQFEEKLSNNATTFEYLDDDTIEIGDVAFTAQTKIYDSDPAEHADQHAAFAFLSSRGLSVAAPAILAQLIHIPHEGNRQALMIVYLETGKIPTEMTHAEHNNIINRAIAGLSLRTPHQHDH